MVSVRAAMVLQKTIWLSFLWLLSACAAAPNARNAGELSSTHLAAEVMAAERAWLDAYERGDADAMKTILADEFVITYPGGQRLHRQDVLLRVASAATREPDEYQTEGSRVYGSRPVVIITGIVNTYTGQRKSSLIYTDTWVWRARRWQVLASHLSAPPGK